MKKFIILLLTCLLSFGTTFAQSECDILQISSSAVTVKEGIPVTLTGTGMTYYRWFNGSDRTDTLSKTESLTKVPTATTTYTVKGYTTGPNLVQDGDFNDLTTEGPESTYPFENDYTWTSTKKNMDLYPSDYITLHDGTYAIGNSANHWVDSWHGFGHGGFGNFMIVNGTSNLHNNDQRSIVWKQTVNIDPNSRYTFSTWASDLRGAAPAILQFSINDVVLGTPFETDGSYWHDNTEQQFWYIGIDGLRHSDTRLHWVAKSGYIGHWDQFYQIWNSEGNSTATISILNLNRESNGNDFGIDDIEMHKIIECEKSITITVLPKVQKDTVIEGCETAAWRDKTYTQADCNGYGNQKTFTYRYNSSSDQISDTIWTVKVTVNQEKAKTVEENICSEAGILPYTITVGGEMIEVSATDLVNSLDPATTTGLVAPAGTYTATKTIAATNGCDSTITYKLYVNPVYNFIEKTDTILNTEISSYNWHGQTVTETTTLYESNQTIDGCDSNYVKKSW